MKSFENFYDNIIKALPDIFIGIVIIIITILLSILIRRIVSKKIKPRTKNPLLADFIGKVVGLSINIAGIILFLEIIGLGDIAGHLMAGAGIATFVIGFAFKDIGENFLSGILLAFNSPFGLNDLIETGGISGFVSKINLRETVIKTLDGRDVFVPNSQILKTPLINYTIDGYLRYDFSVGLDYNSNIKKAIEIIEEKLDDIDAVLKDKKPVIILEDLAASTINIRIYFWINTFDSKSRSYHLKIRSQVIQEVVLSLTDNGFYLPADIVELKNHNNSSLSITK